MATTIAAVVIHHRRFPEVLETLRSLVDAGVPAESVLVVDNSEDDATSRGLLSAAAGWRVHTMPNRGYGAAANTAAGLLSTADILLVVTHEVRIDRLSVAALARALVADQRIAAAGPGLLLTDEGRVWSRGGVLTRWLRLPRQIVAAVGCDEGGVRDVDWLDGACVAYRVDVLAENPFREDFFLYFEETELHTRLRNLGWRVVTVTGASATQSTHGMPAYWGCRNVVLFQRAHGTWWSRALAPVYFMLRSMAISGLRAEWAQVWDAPQGLIAGLRASSGSPDA
jgi:GT2 family glycosyltransferase